MLALMYQHQPDPSWEIHTVAGCWSHGPASPNSSRHAMRRLGLGCRWCNPFRALDLGDQVEMLGNSMDIQRKIEDFTIDLSKKNGVLFFVVFCVFDIIIIGVR